MTDQTNQSETDDQAAAAAAAEAAAAATVNGGAADEAKPWYDGLPDDLKGNKTVAKYASLEDAARALVTGESQRGVPPDQLLRLPKDGDDKAWGALWDKLGRPKDVKDYGLAAPEGAGADQQAFSGYLEAAHKSGLSKAQATALYDWYNGTSEAATKALEEQIQSARAEALNGLKKEWGAAYDERAKAAGEAAKRFGGDDLLQAAADAGLADDPRFIKTFAAIAEAMAEAGDKGLPDQKGRTGGRGAMTPSEAVAELAKLDADKDVQKARLDKSHAQHNYWTQRYLDLFGIKNGGS